MRVFDAGKRKAEEGERAEIERAARAVTHDSEDNRK